MNEDVKTKLLVVNVLNRAAEYVDQGWTQNANARDETGVPVRVDDPKAIRWCALGAMLRATRDYPPETRNMDRWEMHEGYVRGRKVLASALELHDEGCLTMTIAGWNDNLKQRGSVVAEGIRTAARRLSEPGATLQEFYEEECWTTKK